MFSHLQKYDPQIFEAVTKEIERQKNSLEMIASENIVSMAVLEALGTPLTNKYSEGYPGKRYYGGNEFIDICENLARDRAKQLFGAEHANVQPHAGSQANLAAYLALLEPGNAIMAMNLAQGGHLTHGSPVNFSGKLYKIVPYGVRPDTHRIDMDEVREIALREKPRLIIAGATVYPRLIDFAAFRKIADEVGAYFMVDMAHIAGLVAAKIHPDPVPHADIVTSTTHKTLRGPRGGMILCKTLDRLRPEDKKNLAGKVDSAVFPGLQGGPLDHVIAAKAVALKEALEPGFVDYQKQIVKNAQALAQSLITAGISVISGGTDNHLVLADLTPTGVGGKEAVVILDSVGICTNMNLIPNDPRKPMDPSGLRVGTPALTTRGMAEKEMTEIGALLARALNERANPGALAQIKKRTEELAQTFPIYPELT